MLVLGLPFSVSAQAPGGNPAGQNRTTTVLVARFSPLENELSTAIQKHDSTALEKLVADDFLEWTPAPDPIPREDWTAAALKSSVQSFRIRQMSVQMADHTAVVNFMLHQTGKESGQFFVVDLWKQHGEAWQLATRYVASVSAQPQTGSRNPPRKE